MTYRQPRFLARNFCALVFGALLSLLASSPGQSVPTGFADEVVASGFTLPTGFDFLPDGRVLVVEQQTGAVKVLAAGQINQIGTIPDVNLTHGDRGVMAIAVDPGWPTWPYVYVHYTKLSTQSVRIARMTATGDLTDPASTNLTLGPVRGLLDAPDHHPFHNGGKIRFSPDGFAFVSLGDDYGHCTAQDPTILTGCVLRLDFRPLHGQPLLTRPDPSILAAAGNPFPVTSAHGNEAMVYAIGLRNPYSMHLDPVTGNLYLGEVGGDRWEALHEATGPGQNFGWPFFEAILRHEYCAGGVPPGYRTPIANYGHPIFTAQACMSFGGRYRNATTSGLLNFGPTYEGDVFYVDYYIGQVKRLRWSGVTWLPAPAASGQPSSTVWASGQTFVTDSAVGHDGALYYLRRSGELRRIRPTGATLVPVSGNNTTVVGTAGWPLREPYVVEARNALGQPVAGVPVQFAITQGGGTLSITQSLTNALGRAETRLTLDAQDSTDPIVTATASGAAPATFTATWRGLQITVDTLTPSATLQVTHSQANAPLTVAFDLPTPTPYVSLEVGQLFTSLLTPSATFFALDGLGITGPAVAGIATDQNGHFTITLTGFPTLGSLSLTTQAYALDTSLLPSLDAYFISNPVTFTLP